MKFDCGETPVDQPGAMTATHVPAEPLSRGARVMVHAQDVPLLGTVTRPPYQSMGLRSVDVAMDCRPDVPEGFPFVARWVKPLEGR